MIPWIESRTGLLLLDPWMLLLVILVPAALAARRLGGSPAMLFGAGLLLGRDSSSGAGTGPPVPVSWRVRLLGLPRALQVLGLVLAVIALARPVERTPLPFTTEGMDIFLCLDTSSSMRSNDMDRRRTRLEVARDAAARFIAARPDDRIGLVCFARYPDLRCPLTLDHDALGTILASVTTVDDEGPEDATAIGAAVARAAQLFEASGSTSRVVILLTDGEENVATARSPDEIAPIHAAQLCEALGVRVYAIAAGVGSGGRDGAIAPIDTTQVERLAERTGGRFFRARDASAVDAVYASIDELERVEIEEPRYRIEERFLPFLVAALILLLAGRVLRSTVFEVLP